MTSIRCPLCGWYVNLNSFDPRKFNGDIELVTVQGLGRGRGFAVVSRESVLGDDEITPMIKDGVLSIASTLIEKGCLTQQELLSKLKLKGVVVEEAEQKERDEILEETYRAGYRERGKIIQDLGNEIVDLKGSVARHSQGCVERDRTITRLRSSIEEKDRLIEDLTEQITELKSEENERVLELEKKLAHRTEQAKKLYGMVKKLQRKA